MASAHGVADRLRARSKGFRAFTVLASAESVPGAFTCPASEEGGYRRTCATCGACDGNKSLNADNLRADPTIVVHGATTRRAARTIEA
jgi:hypothetical protein